MLRFSRRCAGLLAVLWMTLPALAVAQTTEEALRCLRDNVPSHWVSRVEVQLRQPNKPAELRRMAYAARERSREKASDHWVRMLAPEDLQGVVYLFQQRDPGWERWTYLPAFDRVSRVRSEGTSAAALEEIIGLRELDALLRWPEGAAIQMGAPREQSGRAVRPINATRRVGTGASAGFERMSGLFDVATCLVLSAEWRDTEGKMRHTAEVETASLRQLGKHWLPQRIDVRHADGATARVQLRQSRVDTRMPDRLFDHRHFYKSGEDALGFEP